MDEIYNLTILQGFAFSKQLIKIDESYFKRELQISLLGARGDADEVQKIINSKN
jgi:hypothetical protein